MRKIIGLLFGFAVIFSGVQSANAQTVELLAGNTLNGAVNGTLLGGATMALNNSGDFRPLEVGVGLGVLYGLGTGAYDIAQSGGGQVLVSGLFNDGDNSSIIVLLDTFYGAAAGALIGASITLIAEEPILDGLKYGVSTGAWIGFGFGVIDSFMLAERQTSSGTASLKKSDSANGLVGIQLSSDTSIGLISPSVTSTLYSNGSEIGHKLSPSVDVLNLKVHF